MHGNSLMSNQHFNVKSIPNLTKPHNSTDQFDVSLGAESGSKRIGLAAQFIGKKTGKANSRTISSM